jgi:3'-phosphoadenosine 5'-phosphosulfate sulfotransferase (PAPS reductase)/FAD synthetase
MNKKEKALEWLDGFLSTLPDAPVFGLFSGGHDSLTSTSIAAQHPRFTAAVHINTGIGIEETRQFVRDTCKREGWPLIEMFPDGKTYEDLIMEKGFPGGPKSHNSMYYYLKQRQVNRLVREHKRGYWGRVVLVTGIRVEESARRTKAAIAVPALRKGAQVWVNPILDWSGVDCSRHIDAEGLQRNEVVDLLHRSGECLCGALANKKEIKEIELWFPKAAARIHELEDVARERGLPCVWADRSPRTKKKTIDQAALAMCVQCEFLYEEDAK